MRSRRRLLTILAIALVVIVGGWIAVPYARAVSLIVRAANMGGPVQAFAAQHTYSVSVHTPHSVPTG